MVWMALNFLGKLFSLDRGCELKSVCMAEPRIDVYRLYLDQGFG